MAVYVDDAGIWWRGKRRYHMSADGLSELHEFARELGVTILWFDGVERHPHYDITAEQRQKAIAHGAVAVGKREMVVIARRIRRDE